MSPRYALESEELDESLMIVQLTEEEKVIDAIPDYDETHPTIAKTLAEKVAPKAPDNTDAGNAEPADDATEDASSFEASVEAPPSEAMTEQDGKLTTPATESYRALFYDGSALTMLNYGYEGSTGVIRSAVGNVYQAAKATAGYAASAAVDLGHYLKALGIAYGPSVLYGLKVGVIYLFTKTLKAFFKVGVGAAGYLKRHIHSFERSQADVVALKAALEAHLATGAQAVVTERFTEKKGIEWMSIDGKVSPIGSALALAQFSKEVVENIDRGVEADVDAVRRMIELSRSGLRGNPIAFLKVSPFSGKFLKRRLQGYEKDPELIETMVYGSKLPNHVLFVAQLPIASLTEIEDLRKAYQGAGVFLAPDLSPVTREDGIDYMTASQLARFLDTLEALSQTALSHQSLYRRIVKMSDALKFGYQHYYQSLVETKEQATIRSTLVEYVYLKQSFIARIYLPAAMDLHDYLQTYLTRSVSYAKKNLDALKRAVPTE